MVYPMFVCPFLCLFLSIFMETTDWIFMKILPELYQWTGKNWLNFGGHPFLDSDGGICLKNSSVL